MGRQLKFTNIGFIGGGNMASAIGAALIREGICPTNIWVSARTERTYNFWNDLGVHFTLKNDEIVSNCFIIFLAVKPNMLDHALSNIMENKTEKFQDKLFISLLAGISLDTLYNKLSKIVTIPKIIRCMPNTPVLVGEGIIVYCSKNVEEEDLNLMKTLFPLINKNGISEIVPESLINAIGGLAGSGPAFAYLIIEALANGGIKMGIPKSMAIAYAAQVLIGAGKMVLNTNRHPAELKDEVCSPGGTSITGVHAMEMGGVRASMMNAVEAAVNRTNELASIFK